MASRLKLEKQVFAYSVLKAADPGMSLRPLRDFILPTPVQLADHNPSKIVYILGDYADSEDTAC